MMNTINIKDLKRYIKSHGFHCPACLSVNIVGSADPELEGTRMYQRIKCNTCGLEWDDEYKLVNIRIVVPTASSK